MNARSITLRALACALATLGLGASTGCSYATVNSGELGVLWTPDGIEQKVYHEGSWHIGVWDKVTIYSARSQEREERLEVLAANGLRIELDASVRYHIVPEEVLALDRELGVHFYSTLLGPTVRSQARRVVGRYQPEEIYSTQRETIERLIREGVEKAVAGRHIVLEAVLIRNVTLPDTIQGAINNKLEAEQQALKMKFVIAEAEAEAQKKMIEEKAEAERQKVRAESMAESDEIMAKSKAKQKEIDAKATDEYERIVQQHMTDKQLEWERIKAQKDLAASPNSKTVIIGSDKTVPILEVK